MRVPSAWSSARRAPEPLGSELFPPAEHQKKVSDGKERWAVSCGCLILVKEAVIFAGNYGSGKTELALNTALEFAKRGSTVLCDIDIVNPYFRSAEHRTMLEKAGVRLVAPPAATTMVDIPALPPEVMAAFEADYAVFDVGGDSVGATALGAYREAFSKIRPEVQFLFVVNARRPLQRTARDVTELMQQIESCAGLRVDALVNNTNVGRDTNSEDLAYGREVCAEVSARTGVPVAFSSGVKDVVDGYSRENPDEPVHVLKIYTRPEWLDATAQD